MYERSYHSKVIKTDPKVAKRERSQKLFRRWLIGGGVCVVLGALVVVLRLPGLQVKTVTVEGAEVVDPVDIEQTVFSQLQGNYLFVIPKTSIILVPLDILKDSISKTYPRLDSVKITQTGPTTLTVTVSEYHAKYLWCIDVDATCYLMDQNGTVYSTAPYFSGVVYPKIFKGSLFSIPFAPLSDTELSLVSTFHDTLPNLGIVPAEFHFDSPHTLRIVFSHEGHDADLFFDPSLPLDPSLSALYSALHTDPLAELFANTAKTLEYLDLRYGGKVIYKFQ